MNSFGIWKLLYGNNVKNFRGRMPQYQMMEYNIFYAGSFMFYFDARRERKKIVKERSGKLYFEIKGYLRIMLCSLSLIFVLILSQHR